MPDFYLRVDAVNMAWSIYDTQDLSTLRGGGLIALNTPKWLSLDQRFDSLTSIAQGASSGLFRFEADNLQAAQNTCRDLAAKLLEGQVAPTDAQAAMRHFTFVVDMQPAVGNADPTGFDHAEQALLAKNRYRQMQHLSLRWPGAFEGDASTVSQVCAYDGFRPVGARNGKGQDTAKGKPASASVWERREYGKANKHMLYSPKAGMDAAHHFEELCHDPAQGNAHRKMAVFYVDGNKFSRFFSGQGEKGLSDFDQTMRQRRTDLLHGLLNQLCPGYQDCETPNWPTDWRTAKDDEDDDWKPGRLRLETLLWGGDEIIWVVPAWKGLALAQWFFDQTAQWTCGKNDDPQAQLTHCAGLVFCSHKAPIARVTAFAKSLAQVAKDRLGDVRVHHNALCVATLESFDAPAESAAAYLQRITQERIPVEHWVLSPAVLTALAEAMPILSAEDGLPRRVLHRAAQQAYQGSTSEALVALTAACGTAAAREQLTRFAAALAQGLPNPANVISPAIPLAEWWDYAASLDLVDPTTPTQGAAA